MKSQLSLLWAFSLKKIFAKRLTTRFTTQSRSPAITAFKVIKKKTYRWHVSMLLNYISRTRTPIKKGRWKKNNKQCRLVHQTPFLIDHSLQCSQKTKCYPFSFYLLWSLPASHRDECFFELIKGLSTLKEIRIRIMKAGNSWFGKREFYFLKWSWCSEVWIFPNKME